MCESILFIQLFAFGFRKEGNMETKNDFTKGNILAQPLKFAVPVSVCIIFAGNVWRSRFAGGGEIFRFCRRIGSVHRISDHADNYQPDFRSGYGNYDFSGTEKIAFNVKSIKFLRGFRRFPQLGWSCVKALMKHPSKQFLICKSMSFQNFGNLIICSGNVFVDFG